MSPLTNTPLTSMVLPSAKHRLEIQGSFYATKRRLSSKLRPTLWRGVQRNKALWRTNNLALSKSSLGLKRVFSSTPPMHLNSAEVAFSKGKNHDHRSKSTDRTTHCPPSSHDHARRNGQPNEPRLGLYVPTRNHFPQKAIGRLIMDRPNLDAAKAELATAVQLFNDVRLVITGTGATNDLTDQDTDSIYRHIEAVEKQFSVLEGCLRGHELGLEKLWEQQRDVEIFKQLISHRDGAK